MRLDVGTKKVKSYGLATALCRYKQCKVVPDLDGHVLSISRIAYNIYL
jgi:hypothetical protein